jgi:hypothetical protein
MEYEYHPASMIFPMMSSAEMEDLIRDIKLNGLVEPIVICDGMILDGRNRMRACKAAGVTPQFFEPIIDSSPTLYALSKNLHRRHLTSSQRSAIAVEIKALVAGEAKQRMKNGASKGGTEGGRGRPKNSPVVQKPEGYPSDQSNDLKGNSRDIAGNAVGVSGTSVQLAERVKKEDPQLFQQVKDGEIPLHQAVRAIAGKPAKSKRTEIQENSAKERMVKGLSVINGTIQGLGTLKIEVLLALSVEDRNKWAKFARDCAYRLREFAGGLEGKK